MGVVPVCRLGEAASLGVWATGEPGKGPTAGDATYPEHLRGRFAGSSMYRGPRKSQLAVSRGPVVPTAAQPGQVTPQ